MLIMDMIAEIRRRHLVSKESISSIVRGLKSSRPTVRKHCRTQTDPVYRRDKQPAPRLGAFQETLETWLRTERLLPKAQRPTARRLFEGLQPNGYRGAYDSVQRFVQRWKFRDDVFGYAVGKIFLLRIAAHIGKGQDSNGGFVWQGQGGGAVCGTVEPGGAMRKTRIGWAMFLSACSPISTRHGARAAFCRKGLSRQPTDQHRRPLRYQCNLRAERVFSGFLSLLQSPQTQPLSPPDRRGYIPMKSGLFSAKLSSRRSKRGSFWLSGELTFSEAVHLGLDVFRFK